MPAPATIRTQMGSPVLLSNLSAEAGAASARRDSAQRAYQMQLQQMAQDQAFLRDEANRRFTASTMIPQRSPTMLTDASGLAPRPQTVTNPNGETAIQRYMRENQVPIVGGTGGGATSEAMQQYMKSHQTPVPSRTAANGGAAGLVPSSGPITPRTPSVIQQHGGPTFTRFPEGTQVITAAGAAPGEAQVLREMDPRFGTNPNMPSRVTPQVRAQLDAVRAMKGVLPDAQYNMLEQAAMSGQLNMGQLLDDVRLNVPKPPSASSRLTASSKQAEKAQANVQIIDILNRGTPQDRALFAEQMGLFEPVDPKDMYGQIQPDVVRANLERGDQSFKSWANTQQQLADAYGGDLPVTGSGTEQPSSQRQSQGGYEVGQTYSGMKYLGGDPNNESSWSK